MKTRKEELQDILRQGECEFIFIKKNGEEREALGTLHPDYLPIQDQDAPRGQSNETEDTLTYFDLNANNWRRFIIDSLISDPELVVEP